MATPDVTPKRVFASVKKSYALSLLIPVLLLTACAAEQEGQVRLGIQPQSITIPTATTTTFRAIVVGESSVSWTATGGSISGAGLVVDYTAPSTPGSFEITVRSDNRPSATATARITVVASEEEDDSPEPRSCSASNNTACQWTPRLPQLGPIHLPAL